MKLGALSAACYFMAPSEAVAIPANPNGSVNGGAVTLLDRVAHSAGGSDTDNTGLNGSNTITYQVCTPSDLGAVICSETIRLVY